jgi:hypothetical protein
MESCSLTHNTERRTTASFWSMTAMDRKGVFFVLSASGLLASVAWVEQTGGTK